MADKTYAYLCRSCNRTLSVFKPGAKPNQPGKFVCPCGHEQNTPACYTRYMEMGCEWTESGGACSQECPARLDCYPATQAKKAAAKKAAEVAKDAP